MFQNVLSSEPFTRRPNFTNGEFVHHPLHMDPHPPSIRMGRDSHHKSAPDALQRVLIIAGGHNIKKIGS